MNVTISNEVTDELLGPFELSEDMALMDLLALIEFDESLQTIWYNMKQLDVADKNKTLSELGFQNDAMLVLRSKTGQNASANSNPAQYQSDNLTDDQYVEQFRLYLIENPSMGQGMGIPNLNQLINNKEQFHQVLGPALLSRRGQRTDNPLDIPNEEYTSLINNPDDPVNQARIVELINQKEIDEQLRYAMEYTPESFTQVYMLYIKLEINGHPVKAFVDSGAQTTIMSTRLAERTNLTSLIDKRFGGIAQGVGTGKILGRIHTTQVKIHDVFLPCSFTVLDTPMDMLLGLDMLRRHQACIDLKQNVLRISDVETPFLSEGEIPKDFTHPNISDPLKDTSKLSEEVKNAALKRDNAYAGELRVGAGSKSSSKPKQAKIAQESVFSNTNATSNPSVTYSEAHIKQLMDLGFSRKEAIDALDKTAGNVDYAASLLFQ